MRFLTIAVVLATPLVAVAGCLGGGTCNPRGGSPESERSTADFDFCGTTMRWHGDSDRLEVVRVGEDVSQWSQWELSFPTPNDEDMTLARIAFNTPANRASPLIGNNGNEPLGKYASGPMHVGQYFSLCREYPDTTVTTYVGISPYVPNKIASVFFPATLRHC